MINYTEEEILREQVRQGDEEGLRFYKPHSKQVDFHKSRALQRGLFGGNQSGKSFAGCCEIAYTVGKCHPYRPNLVGPVFARDCCVAFNTVQAILVPTYQKLLPRKACRLDWNTFEGKPATWPGLYKGDWRKAYNKDEKILRLADKSFIEFKTYEQGREAMQGAQRHIIRHDEEPTEPIYEENLARQITLQTNILFTLTPLNYSQWLYERIYQLSSSNDKIDAFMMSVYENPYANLEAIEALAEASSDPAIKAARLHGEFTFLSGRVYKEYGDHNLVAPFVVPSHWERTVVIDPHLSKATAVNIFARDPHKEIVYCIAEGDLEGDVQEICSQIEVLCGGQPITKWLIDPSANQQTKIHGKGRLIDEFRKRFRYIIPANNQRELGWDAVRQVVKPRPAGPRFRVFKNCAVTDHQLRNYMWKKPLKTGEDRNKPEVHKRKDDHADCVRYMMMSRPSQVYGQEFSGFNIGMVS